MTILKIITNLKDIDTKSYGGQSIFDLYPSILNQFKSDKNTVEIIPFFATPRLNKGKGEIVWNTSYQGTQIPLSNLNESQTIEAHEVLINISSKIENLANNLEKLSPGNKIICSGLRELLTTPNLSKSLFLVGDSWVLTQWGCSPYGVNSNNFTLEEQFKKLLNDKNKVQQQPVPIIKTPDSFESNEPNSLVKNPNDSNENLIDIKKANDNQVKEVVINTPNDIYPTPTDVIVDNKSQRWRWLFLAILFLLLIFGSLIKGCQSLSPTPYQEEVNLRKNISDLWDKIDQKITACLPNHNQNGLSPIAPKESDSAEIDERLKDNSIKRGELNVALVWQGKADLDLYIQEPSGNNICPSPFCTSSNGASGGLDIDANKCLQMSGCTDIMQKPVENASWNNTPPKGTYIIAVFLYSANSEPNELTDIPFSVEVTQDNNVKIFKGIFKSVDMKCKNRCTSGEPKFITNVNVK